jgi:ubiquinone/menaquinone biosynthesis C-methylase UbiE
MDDIAAQIIAHYQSYDEDKRLEDAFGALEKVRSQELIARYLVGPGALDILDVGGATGKYAFWLASLGHRVHLVDIVPRHIEAARRKAQEAGGGKLASLRVGDARALDLPDASADVVLMHVPLYHLVSRGERLRALGEARRVLRPGGVLLAFTITRYAGINYALSVGLVFDEAYYAVMRTEVESGECLNDPPRIRTFNRAFFHLPEEIRAEVQEAGLQFGETLGVMGTAWIVPNLDQAWQDAAKRARLIEVARLLEHEPALGPRMLTVARK